MGAPAAGAAAGAEGASAGSSAAQVSSSAANIASGLDFGGNMLWNFVSAIQSKRMQKRAMDFTEKMYGKRYQTAVKDLVKAGLNPMLAYMSPQPATGAPAGSSGSFNSSKVIEGVAKKNELELVKESINTQRTQQEVNSAVSERERSQRDLNIKTAGQKMQEIEESKSRELLNSALKAKTDAEATKTRINAANQAYDSIEKAARKGVYKSWFGKHILPWLKELNPLMPPVNIPQK